MPVKTFELDGRWVTITELAALAGCEYICMYYRLLRSKRSPAVAVAMGPSDRAANRSRAAKPATWCVPLTPAAAAAVRARPAPPAPLTPAAAKAALTAERLHQGAGAPSFCWTCNRQLQRAPGKGLGLFYFALMRDAGGAEHRVHGGCIRAPQPEAKRVKVAASEKPPTTVRLDPAAPAIEAPNVKRISRPLAPDPRYAVDQVPPIFSGRRFGTYEPADTAIARAYPAGR